MNYGCLMLIAAIFYLDLGSQFYWQRKLEKTNKMSQKGVNVDGHLLGVCHTHLLPPNI